MRKQRKRGVGMRKQRERVVDDNGKGISGACAAAAAAETGREN